jgi:hypothetical protein
MPSPRASAWWAATTSAGLTKPSNHARQPSSSPATATPSRRRSQGNRAARAASNSAWCPAGIGGGQGTIVAPEKTSRTSATVTPIIDFRNRGLAPEASKAVESL